MQRGKEAFDFFGLQLRSAFEFFQSAKTYGTLRLLDFGDGFVNLGPVRRGFDLFKDVFDRLEVGFFDIETLHVLVTIADDFFEHVLKRRCHSVTLGVFKLGERSALVEFLIFLSSADDPPVQGDLQESEFAPA